MAYGSTAHNRTVYASLHSHASLHSTVEQPECEAQCPPAKTVWHKKGCL
ncbi:MAG: hypothetical protein LBO67_07795 [Spirochaetaceae bacterium]|nr:hypothetical protein [Spirochaetaceae bacterium]